MAVGAIAVDDLTLIVVIHALLVKMVTLSERLCTLSIRPRRANLSPLDNSPKSPHLSPTLPCVVVRTGEGGWRCPTRSRH